MQFKIFAMSHDVNLNRHSFELFQVFHRRWAQRSSVKVRVDSGRLLGGATCC